jgi:membrane protein implicated in regulation of membrane protease activity
MPSLDNDAVVWFVLGFVLFLLEFVMPGFILFFFAVGAWIVALLTLLFDLSINVQLIVFMASSVLSILFFRKWLRRVILSRKTTSEIEDEFIGKTAITETPIEPGKNGKVQFKGTTWEAQSNEFIPKGQRVIITGNESILLIVKTLNS